MKIYSISRTKTKDTTVATLLKDDW
jgi:hypothetical protein